MEESRNRVLHFVWRAGLAAFVLCGPAVAQQGESTPQAADSGAELEEVVVTGIRAGLRTSLEIKRNSEQVVDAISAEDIGDFPDKNLGEALQRITGVQIQRQSGEGRSVSIRGAEPGLNRVEINGSSALSLSVGGGRDVDFRDLPVEFVSRMEVVKSATPDMTEGGIGGTVRIFTRRPFDTNQPYLAGSAQMVYSNLAEEYDPKFALIGSRTFLDDRFGVLIGATYEERHLYDNQSRTTGWLDRRTDPRASGVTAFLPDIPRYLINRRETKRPAVSTILEWRAMDNATFYAEGTYARGKEEVTDQLMQLSGSAGVIDASTVVVGPDNTITHYEVVDSPTNRLALTYRNILGSLTRETYTTALGADWEGERFRLDGKLTYAMAEVHNDEKNSNAVITGLPRAIVDYNNSQQAPNFTFPGVDVTSSEAVTQLDAVFNPRTNVQDEVSGKLNVEYRPDWNVITALKTGIEARTLKMDQVFFGETVTLNGITNPALLPQIRSIVDQYSLVNDIPFFKTGDLGFTGGIRHWIQNGEDVYNATGNPTPYDAPRLLDTWEVEEETWSGYVQASFAMPDLAVPVSGVFGVRLVDTSTLSTGFNQTGTGAAAVFTPAAQDGGYTKWLPSLNVRLNLIPDTLQGRLTAGKVMARPRPQDLALRRSLDIVGLSGSRGNPDLQPFEADQYDAGLEWYFSDESYVSATYFRKEISSFITNQTSQEVVDGEVYLINSLINGDDRVTINGIEAGAQYVFDFLPQPFNGFGALANVTYQEDSGYEEVDVFTGEKLPFQGLSRTSYNASLYFENQRFGVRASYNWRDDYLITPRGRGNNPEFGEAFGSLDASASFNLTDSTTFFFEGINLTDEVRIENANSEMRRTVIETFGRRYFAGVRMRL